MLEKASFLFFVLHTHPPGTRVRLVLGYNILTMRQHTEIDTRLRYLRSEVSGQAYGKALKTVGFTSGTDYEVDSLVQL